MSTNENFIERNKINVEEISKKVDCINHSISEINPIINDYGIYPSNMVSRREISLADIIGYVPTTGMFIDGYDENFFKSLPQIFNENGDTYHSRSTSLLQINSDEIMEILKESFEKDPIIVQSIGNNRFVVYSNGMHRFITMKINYIKELAESQNDYGKQVQLKHKYTFPVVCYDFDKCKTYSNFLLQCFDLNVDSAFLEVDEKSSQYTGNTIVKYLDGKEEIFNDESLIKLVKQTINECKNNEYPTDDRYSINDLEQSIDFMKREKHRKNIQIYYNENKDFKEFADLYLKDVEFFEKESDKEILE